ncbi:mandelate racemase/muconate lactonizing enzyme family protein [Streptomyces sp. t39]|uniref:mandelate racemase/muconate lactonizing enzyme family protein n=1 Tax=Streptomyces sp. t39 TaxID=1828156 RepID=UPI0011CD4A15|nr:dipeptide epimerase [Streptomyces sp. t39]TXS52022.1 dipeptide epimerase [Streptomyces sp. t39]
MKVTRRTVRLELTEPLRISRSTMAARDAVWLRVEHEGERGWGEVVSSVYYGLDAGTIGRLLSEEAAPELARFPDPETSLAALRSGEWHQDVPPAVAAAVESALLDLCGKRAGVPVHRLLGTGAPPSVGTARTIGITSPGRAAAQANRLARDGFTILKVKAGSPDPHDDVERVRAVRAAAPRVRLLLDPNGGWTPRDAERLLPLFADLGVEAVEQPLAPGDPEALARLAERSPLPVVADEDAAGPEDARRLAGRVQGINVKLAKCGGVTAALRIAELLAGSGTDLMLGCLTASTLGISPAVHIADRARWADLDGHLLLARDPWTGIGGADGTVRASRSPGLGVRPAADEPTGAGSRTGTGT